MKSPVPVCRLVALLLVAALVCGCRADAPVPSQPMVTPRLSGPTAAPASNTPPAPPPTLSMPMDATPVPSPTPACAEAAGRLESRELDSPNLPRPLQVDVYLPPCYDPERARPYPLLVMLHGQGATQAQWADLGLTAAAGRLFIQGEIPPFIIALPYEYDHLKNPFETGYETALVEDLLPWLEGQYRVCAARGCRAVGGLSRGAAYAVRIALSRWEVFAAAGAHSLAPFYGDPARAPAWVETIPQDQAPALWLDSGERDRYRAEALAFSELLDRLEVAHAWHSWPGEHDAAYWSAHVEDYLRWYGRVVGLDY